MNCYCDYEPAAVYDAGMVTTRWRHICEECGRTIRPGERAERARGCWDGHWATYYTCTECLELRQHVAAHVPCFCWAHGNMIQDARDALEALSDETSETAGVLFGAGRRLVAIRRRRQEAGRATDR